MASASTRQPRVALLERHLPWWQREGHDGIARADRKKHKQMKRLARATSADTNIKTIEVETVQGALKRITGEDIGSPEIRVAAKSELFEDKPLEKYLAGIGRQLGVDGRAHILVCLAEVIRSDERISHFETEYFDMVAGALKATPSEIVGLIADES